MEVDSDEITNRDVNPCTGAHFWKLFKNNQRFIIRRDQNWKKTQQICNERRAQNFDGHRNFTESLGNIPVADKSISHNLIVNKSISRMEIANLLMLGTELTSLPGNLNRDFVMKVCPAGERVIIMSRKCRTRLINLQGRVVMTFHSKFPGGFFNSVVGDRTRHVSVLDGIFDRDNSTLYLLDVLEYGSHDKLANRPLVHRSEYLEHSVPEDLRLRPTPMELDVIIIPALPCNKNYLCSFLVESFPIDGVLLYRKAEPYTSGRCSAVIWVPIDRVDEMLRADCIPEYCASSHDNTTNLDMN